MTIFKAYDVRGKYPSQIDEDFARRFGAATSRHLKGGRIAVGRDTRLSAPAIAAAVCEGIQSTGATALDLGLVTSPMTYFAVGSYGLSGGVMVTASHNPPGDIGFKVCREMAIPIGSASGLKQIEADMAGGVGNRKGPREDTSIRKDYRKHIRSFLTHVPSMKIAVDMASGAVAEHFDFVFGDIEGIVWERLCSRPDGTFPNHEPNPLVDENVQDLRKALLDGGAALGVAFDGDGDRVMFFDRGGARIRSDLLTILLARAEKNHQNSPVVVYDLRSSRVVHDEIVTMGGFPVRERVGHAFIKHTMRRHEAAVGGELSGHYYFRDNFFADSGMLALAKILDLMGREKQSLDRLIEPYLRTVVSGELNFKVEDKAAKLREIRREFSDGRFDELDGVTVEYDDWWFNVRPSNTEPYLRLNMEADSAERLTAGHERLIEILGAPV